MRKPMKRCGSEIVDGLDPGSRGDFDLLKLIWEESGNLGEVSEFNSSNAWDQCGRSNLRAVPEVATPVMEVAHLAPGRKPACRP